MSSESHDAPLNIFVTVGTHEQGFPRLLSAVAHIITSEPDIGRWRIQTGPASVELPGTVETRAAYTHEEMRMNLRWADVMISQASPGNVFTALEMNTQPIVIARRHELSEHVDNHQTVFARHLDAAGLAMVGDDSASLMAHLAQLRGESQRARHERLAHLQSESRARTDAWIKRVDGAVHQLFAR
jgi:UDP-N-acetylglucosamine transferase subunit ALG13